jgi:glycosyltransferase involved in cell wall biosynthesis
MTRGASRTWQILTGEYPPQSGGIADYTQMIARGLAARGDEVHVWAVASPGGAGPGGDEVEAPGLTIHRRVTSWSRDDFRSIGRAIDRHEAPRRILVQFAPNLFGYRGMNPHLAGWLAGRRRAGDATRVMFHEVMYIVKPGDRPALRALAAAQRLLASRLLRAAGEVDVNTLMWEDLLRPSDTSRRPYNWCPVPSNIPVVDDPAGVASARRRLESTPGGALIGSFGTFAKDHSALLEAAFVPPLLTQPDRGGVLIGRGGPRVADAWLGRHPGLAGRLSATGEADPGEVSRYLQACDLLVQPYPGGVAGKRGSVMAGLSHGVATVTTRPIRSEPIWTESRAVAVADEGDGPGMVDRIERLLADPVVRARLGEAGRRLYGRRFAPEYTLDTLTSPGSTPVPPPTEYSRR